MRPRLLHLLPIACLAVACSRTPKSTTLTSDPNGANTNVVTSEPAATLPVGAHVERVTTAQTFQHGISTLEPPPAGVTPQVTAGQAWKAYQGGMFPICPGDKLSLKFGAYSDSVAATVTADGKQRLDYVKKPEWVVRCQDVQLYPAGPAPEPGQSSTKATPQTLDAVEVIDPSSGKLLLGFTEDPS